MSTHPFEAMTVERDVMVRVRDGGEIAVDVFRPAGPRRYPVLLSMSPYGKDVFWPDRFPLYDQVDQSPYMAWETENPEKWVPEGYVIVRADTRGTGHSPGVLHVLGRQEQEDCFDVVEWAGTQSWSNGRVGLSGISWFGMLAWLVAALRPPHLRAVIPWDGLSDFYREWAYQGGILHNNFTQIWWDRQVKINQYAAGSLSPDELDASAVDFAREIREHPLDDAWHAERSPHIEAIDIPVLSATSWGSLHLHLRGNVEGFLRLRTRHRQLMIFPGDHITPYYSDWGYAARKRFFDFWLAGVENGAERDPRVRLGLRVGTATVWRDEDDWPIRRTQWTAWHLDAATLTVGRRVPEDEGTAAFESPEGAVQFLSTPAITHTEVTGPASVRVWVRSRSEDLDVFVTLWHIDSDGETVPAYGILGQQIPHGAGLLRASHRELDEDKSLPYRPYHRHTRAQPVPVNEPYALDIEIWPTSFVLAPGDRLRVDISGSDAWLEPIGHNDPELRSDALIGGPVEVLTGGRYDSHLLLPLIPDASARTAGSTNDMPSPHAAHAGGECADRRHACIASPRVPGD